MLSVVQIDILLTLPTSYMKRQTEEEAIYIDHVPYNANRQGSAFLIRYAIPDTVIRRPRRTGSIQEVDRMASSTII